MRTTSELYRALLNEPDGLMEVKIVVNSDAAHPIYLDNISRLNTRGSVFGEDGCFSVGNAVSALSDVVLTDIESTQIPRAAELTVYYRLSNGTNASEWLPVGTLLVDHRTDDPIGNELTLECFDDMMKAEAEWDAEASEWPMSEADALQDIANQMGVTVDVRTLDMLGSYSVPMPDAGQTMRDTLRYIAASHMSNVIITPERQLRLVPLVPEAIGETINAGDVSNLDTASPFSPITGVTLVANEGAEEGFVAGTDAGYMLTAICPWATQQMAEACLQQVSGYVYKPMTLIDAMANPALELGDEMTSEDIEWPLCSIDFDYGRIWFADLSAPADQEVDHEYPYKSSAERRIAAIKKVVNETAIKVDKQAGEINLRVKKDEIISEINLREGQAKIKADKIDLEGDVTVEDGKTQVGSLKSVGTNVKDIVEIKDGGISIDFYDPRDGKTRTIKLGSAVTGKPEADGGIRLKYYDEVNERWETLTLGGTGGGGVRIYNASGSLKLALTQSGIDADRGSIKNIDATDINAANIETGTLKINGKCIAPTAVSLTVVSERLKNFSYTAKYYPALGMVFVRIYGTINTAMNSGYDYDLLDIANHVPNANAALSVHCGKKASALAKSNGAIVLKPLESGIQNYDIYLSGFWFV